jgi:CheY-like chemotaxis protein
MENLNNPKELKLLFADDDPLIAEQLGKFFSRRFNEVKSAGDGKQAVELYHEFKPDLIVTDIQMPVMNGLEMIEEIRKTDKDIPFVVITAFSEIEYLRKAIELQVDFFIEKPVVRTHLDNIIERASAQILNKRAVRERDQMIQTILGWHPYFSIICKGENISHISSNLLNFLGYHSCEEFVEKHHNIVEFFNEIDSGESNLFHPTSPEGILDFLTSKSDKNHIVYLHDLKSDSMKAYAVRSKYFELSDQYLLAFLDPKYFLENHIVDECSKQEICKVCHFN